MEIEFLGKAEQWIPIKKGDKRELSKILKYLNLLENIKAKRWSDEGQTFIVVEEKKEMSKRSVERFLSKRPRDEDRYCYVGAATRTTFEIHYNREKKFVLLDWRGKLSVSLFETFDSALAKIVSKSEGNLLKVKVGALVSNPSEPAVKYGYDTG